MTGYYLLDHPQTIPQHRHPRRAPLSGVVAVHTTEGVLDDQGPDTGAENTAAYICRRNDYGSYHCIVDSDSTVAMAPDDHETWHVAADRHNWHSWGISAACRSVDWRVDSGWTWRTLDRMATEIAAFWARNGHDPRACARFGTRDEALARQPALYLHGTLQPADRSDAWVRHPQRAQLEQMLVDRIHAAAGGPPVTALPVQLTDPPKGDDMRPLVLIHDGATPEQPDTTVFVWDGVHRPRPLAPGEDQVLADLGLVEREDNGRPVLKWLPPQTVQRYLADLPA